MGRSWNGDFELLGISLIAEQTTGGEGLGGK